MDVLAADNICNKLTYAEGVLYPSKQLVIPSEEENIFLLAENIFGLERDKLLNRVWEFDLRGDKKSLTFYKGGNIYNYLSHLAVIIYTSRKKKGLLQNCNINLEDDLKCVFKNLECLSIQYNTPYVSLFKKLLYAIEVFSENCTCCSGVGTAVIDGESCSAFEIGKCSPVFEGCTTVEFVNGEFTCNEFV